MGRGAGEVPRRAGLRLCATGRRISVALLARSSLSIWTWRRPRHVPQDTNHAYLSQFFFDIYPYIAGAVFLIGSWLRYDYGQYSWRAGSSQMLDKKGMRLASNLFHIGILGIFFGHIVRHADAALGV